MRYSSYERPLTFFDILASVIRYKWRVMLVTVCMFALSVVAIFLFPKKYESEAKLFVRLGRGSASFDPATFGQTISIQESRESEMNSIVDMLASRGLAERVVKRVGGDRILKKYALVEVKAEEWSDHAMEFVKEKLPVLSPSTNGETGMSEAELDAEKDFELAVAEMLDSLKIDSPKKSTTLSIHYRARTPELARDVVQAVIDCYRQMHIDAYQSGGALEFFDEQFALQEQLVRQSEIALRNAKNENGIVTMVGKQESLQSEITDVKKLQIQTQAELQAALGKVRKLKQDMEELPEDLISQTTAGIAQAATDAMRDRLYQLEIQEKELTAKYATTHPELAKIREQLNSARQIMTEQPRDREQRVMAINPVRMQVENEMHSAEAAAASLQAKTEALAGLELGLNERLNKVNDLEVLSQEMQRAINIARENHLSYAKKLEESRINAALDREALSNVSVVSAPTTRYKHVSPKRSLMGILGLMLSLTSGVAVALISEYFANAKEFSSIRVAERERYLSQIKVETAKLVHQEAVVGDEEDNAESVQSSPLPKKAK